MHKSLAIGRALWLKWRWIVAWARFARPNAYGKPVSAKSSRIDATLAGQLPAAAALGLLATLLLIGP